MAAEKEQSGKRERVCVCVAAERAIGKERKRVYVATERERKEFYFCL